MSKTQALADMVRYFAAGLSRGEHFEVAADMLEAQAAEIAALKAQISEQSLQAISAAAQSDEHIAALRADAERYRWLRSEREGEGRLVVTTSDFCYASPTQLQRLDAAIDAAIQLKAPE